MRYNSTSAKTLSNGKLVLRMGVFPTIPKRDDDIYIITQETDRLDTLAEQFYEDSTMWWVIAYANSLNSADIGVTPGIQLRIPRNISNIEQLI